MVEGGLLIALDGGGDDGLPVGAFDELEEVAVADDQLAFVGLGGGSRSVRWGCSSPCCDGWWGRARYHQMLHTRPDPHRQTLPPWVQVARWDSGLLAAILEQGSSGQAGVSAAAISFLVSVSIVMFVLVGGEGPRQAEVTVFDEVPETNEFTAAGPEPDRPVWLTDYNTHVPLIGVLTSSFYDDLEAVEQAERDALVDSLSPGVRANYEGARPERAAARKREHEREEVEYAAFIEERMRRLTTTVRATP